MHAGTSRAVYKLRQGRRHRLTRRWYIIIVCAVILLLVAGGLWRWRWQSPTTKAMRILVSQFAAQRPVEGRLTGGFKGGRFVPPTEGDRPSDEMIAASHLIDEAAQRGEQGARLANARLLLLANEKGSAILKAFRQAVEAEPASAAAANDLGVCLLARGELEDALATFDQALQRQPEMPEALFNRALNFEQLQLRDAASADYARLLEIDTDQSWREEIRRRLDAVSAAISQQSRYKETVAAFDRAYAERNLSEASRITDNDPESLLKHVSTTCLLEYLKAAVVTENEVSERELGKIKLVGEHLEATFADKCLLDLVAYLQGLSPAETAAELALALEYEEMARTASRDATETLGIALKLSGQFKARGNHFYEYLATFQAANSSSQLSRFGDAIEKMNEALKIAEAYSWPFRHALGLIEVGRLSARLGQDSLTLNYCKRANIEGHGKPYVQSKTMQTMANAYWHLGNVSQGLEYLRQSSRLFLTDAPSLIDLASNTLLAADFYRQTDRPDLALHYARQALHYAEQSPHQPAIAQAASFIALELAQRHEFGDSQSAMRKAMAALAQIPERQRAYTQSLVLLRAGDIAAQQGSLEQAESRYAEAQRLAESSEEQPLPLLKVLKARAASYTRAGITEKARADLKRAIGLIETYRSRVSEQSNRSDFFDASQDVFDQMIQLEAHGFGQSVVAFNLSEQARARTLLDDLAAPTNTVATPGSSPSSLAAQGSANPLTLDEIRRRLPADLTLLSYSVSRTGTLLFVLTRDTFEMKESAATTDMLDRLVQQYVSSLNERAPSEELAEQSRRLYDLLIAPVATQLGSARRLCIAPDKALHRLPFAALRDPSGNYLLQSHILMGVPSASTLVYCLDKAAGKRALADERFLAVANPQFSREDYPGLALLPEAEREARASADFYKQKVVLTGYAATKAKLLAELVNCDVAHFSTHCLVKEKTPWLAALLLAGVGKDEQLLRLQEFEKIGLLRARLVILSACQSALGQYYRGEGIVSLVRPFLAHGVPTVLASLWPVDSLATTTLMTDFHRARKQNGLLAAEALRAAQIKMLQSDSFNEPYYWAPFVVIGSSN